MTFDSKCYDLAAHFMRSVARHREEDIHALAEAIQEVCEDHCREVEEKDQPR